MQMSGLSQLLDETIPDVPLICNKYQSKMLSNKMLLIFRLSLCNDFVENSATYFIRYIRTCEGTRESKAAFIVYESFPPLITKNSEQNRSTATARGQKIGHNKRKHLRLSKTLQYTIS